MAARYVYGNVAEKNVQILTDPRKDPLRQAREQEQRERRRIMAQAERMSFLYVLFLAAAAAALVGLCYYFLNLQIEMKNNVSEISTLKVELETMKAENDFQLSRVEESIDLDEIYKIATEELGMVEADDSQIISYTYDSSDYVRQYAAVPDQESTSVAEYCSD